MKELRRKLNHLDGKSFGAYKSIRGSYFFDEPCFELVIEHVQGDPFAAPSRVAVRFMGSASCLVQNTLVNSSQRIALADFILRQFCVLVSRHTARLGSGKSGLIQVDQPGQEVLPRSACEVMPEGELLLRFMIGLPASGRRILGRQAQRLLLQTLPQMMTELLLFIRSSREKAENHLAVYERQHLLRSQLIEKGLVAFVENGAILPRESGKSDKPMANSEAVPWTSPEQCLVQLEGLSGEAVYGTGISQGVTLICGGGYHGKSTLLKALARGIYNHLPGDGREGVVSLSTTVKIRAEDGRSVGGVNISSFIHNLPFQQNTNAFYTSDASGSTSQASALMEAVELGAKLLLIDEDTSATNFLIRDHRMQLLVAKKQEPITPLIDRIHDLQKQQNCSIIMVMGGSGEYFEVANHVVVMQRFLATDGTEQAKTIARQYPASRLVEPLEDYHQPTMRCPDFHKQVFRKGKHEHYTVARSLRHIQLGYDDLKLDALEEVVSISQTRTIADAIAWLLKRDWLNGQRCMLSLAKQLQVEQGKYGPGVFSSYPSGDRAMVRGIDIMFAINRIHGLQVKIQRADVER